MQFPGNALLVIEDIDPGFDIQKHDWKKLRAMWMDINSRYKVAVDGFTVSGQHENQFFGFCNQKKDVYYLRQLLNLKPGLNETVRAGLPKDCEIQSDKPIPPIGDGSVVPL